MIFYFADISLVTVGGACHIFICGIQAYMRDNLSRWFGGFLVECISNIYGYENRIT